MAGFTLGGAGVLAAGGAAGNVPALVVTCGAAVGGLLGVVGTAQLGVQLRRALAD
jgi:CDP-diacylglycerol--glycerol-3-phosphate 3-phosphatidyltransferase